MTDKNRRWWSVTSSADGSKLVAVVMDGTIWTSVDSGKNWIESMFDDARDWKSVASSADGNKIVAVASGPGQIYTANITPPAPKVEPPLLSISIMPSLVNNQQLGGYKGKYLKYKQKYLQLKNKQD